MLEFLVPETPVAPPFTDFPSTVMPDAKWKRHVDSYLDGLNTAMWDHQAAGGGIDDVTDLHNKERPE